MIGETYQTKHFGLVDVIGLSEKPEYYRVRFKETGHVGEFRRDAIRRGEIRDKYAVTLCGVGIIGNIKTKGKYHPYYVIWHGIINRCYNVEQQMKKHRISYIESVTVCDRWKTFENFYNDCKLLDGYDKEKVESHELVLDKDLKQRNSKNKVYSPEYCQWIPASENNKIQDAQQRWFIAYSPDGNIYKDFNISDFARKHDLKYDNIKNVLHGKTRTTKGWKFVYEEEIV